MSWLLLNQVRQQAEIARTLDGVGEFTLLLGRDRGDAARHDLAALRHVTQQQPRVLVVDLRRVGAGERAGLATAEKRTAWGLSGESHHRYSWVAAGGASSSRGRRGGRSPRSPRG